MNRLLPIASLIALAGCGGSSTSGTGNSCSITISGAETADVTQTCYPSSEVTGGVAGFGFSVINPSYGTLIFSSTFKSATFAKGTYDGNSLAMAVTTLSGNQTPALEWQETTASSASAVSGTFTLVISSTGSPIHGTLDATLPPAPGNAATTNAIVHVTF